MKNIHQKEPELTANYSAVLLKEILFDWYNLNTEQPLRDTSFSFRDNIVRDSPII
jgi:hypothetical protein